MQPDLSGRRHHASPTVDNTPHPNTQLLDSEPFGRFRSTYTIWTREMEEALLSELRNQVRLGKRADSGFQAEAWIIAVAKVNAVKDTVTISVKQAKNKADWFKMMYKEWLALAGASGFEYDEETDLYTASPEVWKQYLSTHKQATWHRAHSLPFRDILSELFDSAIAAGSRASSLVNISATSQFFQPSTFNSSEPSTFNSEPATFTPPAPSTIDTSEPSTLNTSTPSALNFSEPPPLSTGHQFENPSESEHTRKRGRESTGEENRARLVDAFNRKRRDDHASYISDGAVAVQKALRTLCEEYESRLDPDDVDKAVDALSVKETAIVFISLTGRIRDRWLQRICSIDSIS